MPTRKFYMDVNAPDGGNGNPEAPWNSIKSAWNQINAALFTEDVTIIQNAFQQSLEGIIINRTSPSTNRLKFDGKSEYNENPLNPNWKTNLGSNRHTIKAGTPFSTGTTKRNYVTISGYNLIATQFQIIRYWGGDHILIEYCDLTKISGQTGPGLSIGYAEYINKSSPGPCEDIALMYNRIHDIYWGEACYIGGVEGQNKPGHIGVLIEGNEIFSAAVAGAEPDLLDIKDGVRNLVVRGNKLWNPNPTTGRDGITTISAGLFEDNFIFHCGRNGITFGSAWNTFPNRANSICRNNIIADCGGNPNYGWDYGIYVADAASGDQWTNLDIYGNTIHKIRGTGISVGDNARIGAFHGNNITECSLWQLDAPSQVFTGSHNHNNYYKSTDEDLVRTESKYRASTIKNFESESVSRDPEYMNPNPPYTPEGFKIRSTSAIIDMAVPLTGWNKDFFGNMRGSRPDIGAHEHGNGAPPPPPPDDTEPPVITITNPIIDEELSGIVDIDVHASDNEGVDRVEFYINGQLHHTSTLPVTGNQYRASWNTNNSMSGHYTISARAVDYSNNESIDIVGVTVNNQTSNIPVVTIQQVAQPVKGVIVIEAEVISNEPVNVKFYDGMHHDMIAAGNNTYQYAWDSTSVPDGQFTVTVFGRNSVGLAQDDYTLTIQNAVSGGNDVTEEQVAQMIQDAIAPLQARIAALEVQMDETVKKGEPVTINEN